MNNIDSNKSKSLVRGTMSNPYTEEEYQQLQAEGKDVACYVEGRGFCAPAAMAPPPNPGSPSDPSNSDSSFDTSLSDSYEEKEIEHPCIEVTDGNFKYQKYCKINCKFHANTDTENEKITSLVAFTSFEGGIIGIKNETEDYTYETHTTSCTVTDVPSLVDEFEQEEELFVPFYAYESGILNVTIKTFKLKAEWSIEYDSATSCATFKKIKISLDPA